MDLEAIKARVESAPPGPWKVVGADDWRLKGFPQVEMNTPNGDYFPVSDDATAQFIAHARQDVPDLLARVARLEQALMAEESLTVQPNVETRDGSKSWFVQCHRCWANASAQTPDDRSHLKHKPGCNFAALAPTEAAPC